MWFNTSKDWTDHSNLKQMCRTVDLRVQGDFFLLLLRLLLSFFANFRIASSSGVSGSSSLFTTFTVCCGSFRKEPLLQQAALTCNQSLALDWAGVAIRPSKRSVAMAMCQAGLDLVLGGLKLQLQAESISILYRTRNMFWFFVIRVHSQLIILCVTYAHTHRPEC